MAGVGATLVGVNDQGLCGACLHHIACQVDDVSLHGVGAIGQDIGLVVHAPQASAVGADVLDGHHVAVGIQNLHTHFVARAAIGCAETGGAALNDQGVVRGDEVARAGTRVYRTKRRMVNAADGNAG